MSSSEIEREQRYVDRAYERLEQMRGHAHQVVSEAASQYLAPPGPRRDAFMRSGLRRREALDIGDEALVFGRLDTADGQTLYIGRTAVHDEDYEPLVTDWRAPAAEAFYRATPLQPMGIVRRRHLICRGRRVRQLDDEVLDAEAAAEHDLVFVGEGALLDALQRSRTGRMRDIVATIQAEQDAVIRAPLEGALVVQGGPGTGKTAVGLHRAAYLLYAHRERLTRDGVLVVGPNPIFLRYISQVLPSLGESATLATIGDLAPAGPYRLRDEHEVAVVKGDLRMAAVIERRVRRLPGALQAPVRIRYEGRDVELTPAEGARFVRFAKQKLRGRHNARRRALARLVAEYLWEKWSKREKQWTDVLGAEGLRHFVEVVLGDDAFRGALDALWPARSPGALVDELLSDATVLEQAAKGTLSRTEQELLLRDGRGELTAEDAALVDEALVLLGPLTPPRRRGPVAIDDEDRFMVERMLDDLQESSPEILTMRGVLAERYAQERRALEEDGPRPAQERERFGHLIVDEAQGLNPMQWRMLSRRCPSRSVTVLGDLGQAGGDVPASWPRALAGLAPATVELRELTVNYRTPSEIMDVAARVLAAAAPGMVPPRSVRATGSAPSVLAVPADALASASLDAAREELAALGEGKAAVVSERPERLWELLGLDGPAQMLDRPVGVYTVDEVRGLEFDVVVVAEPAEVAERAAGGLRGLYVALTRATQRLVLVHSRTLPEPLR